MVDVLFGDGVVRGARVAVERWRTGAAAAGELDGRRWCSIVIEGRHGDAAGQATAEGVEATEENLVGFPSALQGSLLAGAAIALSGSVCCLPARPPWDCRGD